MKIFNKAITVLFLVLIAFGCDKIDELTQFTMDYRTQYEIQSSTVIDLPITLASPEVETNSETTFENNNTRSDKVEEVYLREMILTITSPTTGDFGFLESIEVLIDADGLSEQSIASKQNISESVGGTIEMETSGVDIKEYVKKDAFSLKLKIVTDEVISEDYTVVADSEFFVDAKIL